MLVKLITRPFFLSAAVFLCSPGSAFAGPAVSPLPPSAGGSGGSGGAGTPLARQPDIAPIELRARKTKLPVPAGSVRAVAPHPETVALIVSPGPEPEGGAEGEPEPEAAGAPPPRSGGPRGIKRSPKRQARWDRRHRTNPGIVPEFYRDPVLDASLTAASLGFGLLAEAVIFSGELPPQDPQSASKLLRIDRPYASEGRKPVPGANLGSSVLIWGLMGWDIADSVLTGVKEGPAHGWTDVIIHVEALSLNWAIADMAKLAVRRPRPLAYQDSGGTGEDDGDTGRSLSFYSLHVAAAASLATTTTYMSFARDHKPWRKWLTLSLGATATAGVAVGRVLSLNHFPTDVIAGAAIGTTTALVVTHLHRINRRRRFERPLSLSPTRSKDGGWGLSLQGRL